MVLVQDALGGQIKTGLAAEQLKGTQGHRLENAGDVVAFCKEKFEIGQVQEYGDVQLVRRIFWEIPQGAVNRRRKWDCDPIKGCRDLHCFDGFSPQLSTLLQVRELSCFCPSCVDDDPRNCDNEEWAGKYRLEMVKGVLPSDVRAEVQNIGEGEGEVDEGSLAECIKLGDWYACHAHPDNQYGVDFYVYQCEEELEETKEALTDAYGVQFQRGDQALRGRWFQPYPGNKLKFVCNDAAPPSYQHPEEVFHIRFALSPCEVRKGSKGHGPRMYTIDPDTLDAIYESLQT